MQGLGRGSGVQMWSQEDLEDPADDLEKQPCCVDADVLVGPGRTMVQASQEGLPGGADVKLG